MKRKTNSSGHQPTPPATEATSRLCKQLSNVRQQAQSRKVSVDVDSALKRTLKHFSSSHRRWTCRRVLLIACLIATPVILITAFGMYQRPYLFKTFFGVHSYAFLFRPLRLATVPILRLWPWLDQYYRSECLVKNPWYETDVMDEEGNLVSANCACKGFKRVKTVTVEEVFQTESLEWGGQPFVVDNLFAATLGQHGMDTGQFLTWLEGKMDSMDESNCGLIAFGQHSVIEYSVSVSDILKKVTGAERASSFTGAAWMLCEHSPGKKLIEELVPRSLLQNVVGNAGLVSREEQSMLTLLRRKKISKFKTAPMDGFLLPHDSIAEQVQLVGVETVRLLPAHCPRCEPILFQLHAGQVLFYNTTVWTPDLLVNGEAGLSLAFITSYTWPLDENAA